MPFAFLNDIAHQAARSCMYTLVKLVQLVKHLRPAAVIVAGMSIEVMFEQFPNVEPPNVLTVDGSTNAPLKLVQLLKADVLMISSPELAKLGFSRLMQPLNAFSPIWVTEDGIVIECSEVLFRNALSPMLVTLFPTSTL